MKLARLSNLRTKIRSPNLNLIEPRTMLGGEVKHDFMSGVTQEIGLSWHRFKNTRYPFHPERNLKPFKFCHKPNQGFRLMSVQTIHHQMAFDSIRVTSHQVFDVAQIVQRAFGYRQWSQRPPDLEQHQNSRLMFGCRGEYTQILAAPVCPDASHGRKTCARWLEFLSSHPSKSSALPARHALLHSGRPQRCL